MKEMLEKLGLEDLDERIEISMCVQAYKEGGIEGLYKDTLRDKKEARKMQKKEEGKKYSEIQFEVGYIHSQIDHLTKLLNWVPFMESAEERKVIADELTKLAEELRNL